MKYHNLNFSPDNTVPFYGLCQKLAALWSFGALYSTKLIKLKTDSSVKVSLYFLIFYMKVNNM